MLHQSGLGQPNQLDSANVVDVPSRAIESSRSGEGGYKMINSLDIENFRCFQEVSLTDLKTVNLVVGRNASGKTAFLEALYFTLGSPALAFKLKTWRGLGSQVQYTEYTESRNALWRDLFYQFEQDRAVKITFHGTGELERSVRITCRKSESQFVKKGKAQISEIPPIKFQYFRGFQHIATVEPGFTGEGVVLAKSPQPAHGSFYPSSLPIDPAETAGHFSSLSKQGRLESVINAMHRLFPMVEDLSLEMNNTVPMVYASVKGITEKIPVGLVSTGVTKLLAYLVSIANQRGGIVLIDEIENGFYFDTMKNIWEVLREFCVDNDVQLFASTHSAECLEALASSVSQHQGDFSLLRAVRENDRCIIRHFQGDHLLAALEEHMEVR